MNVHSKCYVELEYGLRFGTVESGLVGQIGPKIPVSNKKCLEWGFGCGESEYEVSFGLAPRNGEFSPSDSETPDLLTLRSAPGTRSGHQIRTS